MKAIAATGVGTYGCLILVLAVLGACDSGTEPENVVQYRHSYIEELVESAAVDTVLLLVGTVGSLPGDIDTTTVYIDTALAEEGTLRLNVHVLGRTYDPDDRAFVDHRWSGDTLQVWCGFTPPYSWKSDLPPNKTSYPQPWFMPSRVDVQIPDGVAVRYVGRWYE